jgi:hypothetical protein
MKGCMNKLKTLEGFSNFDEIGSGQGGPDGSSCEFLSKIGSKSVSWFPNVGIFAYCVQLCKTVLVHTILKEKTLILV